VSGELPKIFNSDVKSLVMSPGIDPEDLRDELTSSIKTQIKKAVGNRCEFENKKYPPRYLHAHHLIPLSSHGPNIQSNMIVLCCFCHADAHANKGKGVNGRNRESLRKKIKKRSPELQKKINKILGKRVIAESAEPWDDVSGYFDDINRNIEKTTERMMKGPTFQLPKELR
jgi:hypothetical protein